MNLKSRFTLVVLAAVSVLALAACGGGGGGGGGGGLQIGTQGESLAYDKATLTAPSGNFTVTFKNNSSSQQHNFVLVKGGDDVAAKVDEEGSAAGPPDYLPADKSQIWGHTKMLAGGASESVTFSGVTPGTYTYLCTYPGHYAAGMKGTLTVP
jgi:plastocyanin